MAKKFDIKKVAKKSEEKEEIFPKKPKKVKASKLPYLLGILLGLIVIFGLIQIKGFRQKEKQAEPIKVEKREKEVPLEEIIEEKKPAPPSETPLPTLDKSKITISVLNGNGIRGDAYRTKVLLEKDGFKVATYGNASSFKYQSTIVYYKEGQEEAGKAVEETLKKNGKETKLEKSNSLTKYDVMVIVGKK